MKHYRFAFLLSLILLGYCLQAQQASKIPFQLKWHLEEALPEEMVPLLVESNSLELSQLVERYGGNVRLKVGLLYSIEIPAENVWTFSEENAVEKIEFSNAPAHFLNDTMLIQTRANQVQAMLAPLRQQYTGKGVILGVIDSGIELDHPDFKDSLGNTRVLYIWDQGVPYNPAHKPANYNYGVEWDSTEINNQTSTHDDRATEFGHGSMVTGAAASNGLATGHFKGIAPEVNIITVATDFFKPNWLQTVAEAVDYIFSKADSLGMPCVINASIGTYSGSHDGEDIAARMIDQMIKAKSGRSLVAAAGNAGAFDFHLQHSPIQDTNFTWFDYSSQLFGFQGGLFFQVWSDTADMKDLEFSIGVDRNLGNFYEFRARTAFDSIQNRLNVIYTDSIMGAGQNRIAYVYTYAEESQGRYLLEVAIPQPDSAQYLFRFETAGTGRVDIWSALNLTGTSDIITQGLPTSSQYPAIQNYIRPDSLQTIASSFTCLPSVITVGNYVNRSSWLDAAQQNQTVSVVPGQISVNSSLGPNRRGYLKPDLSSAGDYMFSAGRIATMQAQLISDPSKIAFDSLHMRNGGTSMASPTVAGMVALYLQQCGAADNHQIKQDLLSSIRTDQFTVNVPNPKWGAGKADAMAFVSQNVFQPQLTIHLPDYCKGDTAVIGLGASYQSYLWSTGDTAAFANVTDTMPVFALVQDSVCSSVSDTIQINFRDNPQAPNLIQRSDSLIANVAGTYRWFYNGTLIPGETDSFLVVSLIGDYHAEVSNVFGCSSLSDTLTYLSTNLAEGSSIPYRFYPNPAKEQLFIQLNKDFRVIRVLDLKGRIIYFKDSPNAEQLIEVELGQLDKGVYLIELIDSDEKHLEKFVKW